MRWCLLVLLAGCLSAAAASAWVGLTVPGATVYTHRGQESLARRIASLTTATLPRLGSRLGNPSPATIPIYVYTNRGEFLQDSGLTPFLEGISYSPGGLIRIDAADQPQGLPRTLAHELTHSLLGQRLGNHLGNLPIWVNEGIAGHLSDPVSPSELPGVSQLIHRNGVLSLDEMEHAFLARSGTDAAYLQSRSMIAWLEYRHPDSLRQLLSALAAGDAFDDALQTSTGLSQQDWLLQWQADVPRWLQWLSLLSSPVLYAPLALLLVVIAVLRLRRRIAEDVEETAQEEETADEPVTDRSDGAPRE